VRVPAEEIGMFSKPSVWVAVVLIALIALAPAFAEARAGGGSTSMGSRGTRTYQAPPATPTAPQVRPVERSVTPPPAQTPLTRPMTPQTQPSFFGSHPFLSGLMGGLIGAGIGGLLFGHGFFGAGLGFAGVLGLLLQLALVVVVIRLAMGFFRGGAPQRNFAYATADDPQAGRNLAPDAAAVGSAAGPARGPAARDEIGIADADYAEFERLLVSIQGAWSQRDIGALRRYLTPEMVSYFSERLSSNASAGIENHVEDVQFETGDLAEAWSDGDLQYATVAMRWSARDYVVRSDTGVLVDGRNTGRTEATEVWTFVRAPGGRWLLSAIQQV
jgi:predicted lipid-binding transport protein (Tim44 family)